MTVYTGTDPDTLRKQILADIRQLADPIQRPMVKQRVRLPSGRRVTRWTAPKPLPSLLEQLRDATRPGSTVAGPERRGVPGSRPPADLDALETLSWLYVELSGWHAALELPSPPRQLHGCDHGSCQRWLLAGLQGGPLCASARLVEVDWHRSVLRGLAGRVPTLDTLALDDLARDVFEWWRSAARHAGLTTTELRELRG